MLKLDSGNSRMDGLRLESEVDFEQWVASLNSSGELHGQVTSCGWSIYDHLISKPKAYPCVVVWYEWDVKGTSHDGGCHFYVYPSDFSSMA